LNAANQATTAYAGGLSALGGSGRAWSMIENIVGQQALTLSVNDVSLLCMVLFLVMIPVVWFARPPFGNVAGPGGH
jgi:DHA2 family multidrug resistance protein